MVQAGIAKVISYLGMLAGVNVQDRDTAQWQCVQNPRIDPQDRKKGRPHKEEMLA